jgi:hypothetical protein
VDTFYLFTTISNRKSQEDRVHIKKTKNSCSPSS